MQFQRKQIDFEIDENGCFICTSHARNKGYPLSWFDGKKVRLSRFIYEQMHGEIPEGHVIRHKCDVRECINPEHLETGTQKENVWDAIKRNRFKSRMGGTNNNSKLTVEKVKEIKVALENKSDSNYGLARRYGVSDMAIRKIKKSQMWAHVKITDEDRKNYVIHKELPEAEENPKKIYALYKGDEFISEGTIEEISQETGKTVKTLEFFTYPAYKKRCKPNGKRLRMILLEGNYDTENVR